MRVTINLAKGSGPGELMQVLQAVEARATPRSHLDPLTMLSAGIHKILALALNKLEELIRQYACQWVCDRADRLNEQRKKLQQTLFARLRITIGSIVVKSS
jgi:hypothetical protein